MKIGVRDDLVNATSEQKAYDIVNNRFNVSTFGVHESVSLINADESVSQSVIIDKTGLRHVDVFCSATTATTFTISVSLDNITYYDWAVSGAVNNYTFSADLGFPYVRVSSTEAGTSGTDTVTIIIVAI